MAVTKKKTTKKPAAGALGKPMMKTTKKTLSSATLVAEATMMMDDPISKAQARDFVASLNAVIEENLNQGNSVNVFGLLKLTPRYHTKGVREVREVFGDPESKMVKKTYPAKVSLKATVLKKAKDALPSPASLAKKVV